MTPLGLDRGNSLDLDFHTIPFHGEDALVKKHYVSKRSRRQKGILAFLAQDSETWVFCCANAQVRKGGSERRDPTHSSIIGKIGPGNILKKRSGISGRLLREGVGMSSGRRARNRQAILRDYINATIGFEKLSGITHKSAKSLMRMLGPKGNPQARNLFEVIAQLQKSGGLRMELSLKRS